MTLENEPFPIGSQTFSLPSHSRTELEPMLQREKGKACSRLTYTYLSLTCERDQQTSRTSKEIDALRWNPPAPSRTAVMMRSWTISRAVQRR